MVTVVATQELKAEDLLRQFKAEASQDDIHDGSRSISARLVFGNCCYTWDSSQLYVVLFFFLSWFTCVVLLLVFGILYKVTAHAC